MQRTPLRGTGSCTAVAPIQTRTVATVCSLVLLTCVGLGGCIPSTPQKSDDNKKSQQSSSAVSKQDTPNPDKKNDKRPSKTSRASAAKRSTDPLIETVFEDNFDRDSVGSDWNSLSSAWKIENGKLCARGARNQGIWLKRRLPENARIEFEATSNSPDGDLKAELWGDGKSGATATSYTNATSYLVIFGGWKNAFHVLARIDEHGKDRLEITVNSASSSERERPVAQGQTYRFRVERNDGKTISWWINDTLMHRLTDGQPLKGPGHEHLGFNDWEAPVCFDNLKITPL